MTRTKHAVWVCAAICAGLVVLAFVAAPESCEWGLDTYARAGVAALLAGFALPFVVRVAAPLRRRVALAVAFSATVTLVWVAGLFAADVRIICRLM